MDESALTETYLYSARAYENDAYLYRKYGPGPYRTLTPDVLLARAKLCREAASRLLNG